MLWPAPHPCQAKTRGKAEGEELVGEERPGAVGALSPRHPAHTHPPHAAPPGCPSLHSCSPRGLARGLHGHPGGRKLGPGSPCAWGKPGLRSSCTRPWLGGPSLPLPSQTPVVLHEHLLINSIIIQLLVPTPQYIAQSKLAEIH